MNTQINEYVCDWKDCKATFVDRNKAAVGDRCAPPEWGHATAFHMTTVNKKKGTRRYRNARLVHLCPEHADALLSLVRHEETIE
jgi:hypothetical protein